MGQGKVGGHSLVAAEGEVEGDDVVVEVGSAAGDGQVGTGLTPIEAVGRAGIGVLLGVKISTTC